MLHYWINSKWSLTWRKHFCKLRKYQFHLWHSVFFCFKFYLVLRILEEQIFGNPFAWFLVNQIGKFECVSANVFPDLFLWTCFGDCVSNLHLVLNVYFIFRCLLFFCKKSIFRNVYISVNTIFQCFEYCVYWNIIEIVYRQAS